MIDEILKIYKDELSTLSIKTEHGIARPEVIENPERLAERIVKLLNIPIVSPSVESERRELLKKWWKYFDKEMVAVNCNEQEREEVINDFFNGG